MTPTEGESAALDTALAEHQHRPGALLPILHALQDRIGYVPAAVIPHIAAALNLSRAEVHGVVSFYPHFRGSPPGRHVLQICQAESCQALGSAALTELAQRVLNIGLHQTTVDGEFTLEPVYCLGNCACSPAVTLDDEIHGRVDPQRLAQLLDGARGMAR